MRFYVECVRDECAARLLDLADIMPARPINGIMDSTNEPPPLGRPGFTFLVLVVVVVVVFFVGWWCSRLPCHSLTQK